LVKDQKNIIIQNDKIDPIPMKKSVINKIILSKKDLITTSLKSERKIEKKSPPTIRINKEKKRVDPTEFQKKKAGKKVDNFASDQLRDSMERKKELIQEAIHKK
jgi:hypothetical protein